MQKLQATGRAFVFYDGIEGVLETINYRTEHFLFEGKIYAKQGKPKTEMINFCPTFTLLINVSADPAQPELKTVHIEIIGGKYPAEFKEAKQFKRFFPEQNIKLLGKDFYENPKNIKLFKKLGVWVERGRVKPIFDINNHVNDDGK